MARRRGGCLIAAAVVLVLLVASAWGTWMAVFDWLPSKKRDDPRYSREAIQGMLAGETRVFYSDGTTPLGAFFDVNHRIYVPFDSIPRHVVDALVAAEDARYWQHNGFDLRGFSRAMWHNISHGRMSQGGSSLTQQAAKNIFGREETSIEAKWIELQDALALEERYSKKEILEFYLNQFYVSGTGRGLAIAAWHFFSKDLSDLSLAECAFISGSVKGPANYDPFVARTPAAKKRALERGEYRLRYVLGRMVENGYITTAQQDSALAKPLQFRQGQFRFSLSTPLERIEDRLDGPYFTRLFDSLGVSPWQKAGLEIVGSLDDSLEHAARRSLQGNLSRLQFRLSGPVFPGKDARPGSLSGAVAGDFLLARLDSLLRTGTTVVSAHLSFGADHGIVPAPQLDSFAVDGLFRAAGANAAFNRERSQAFLVSQLKPGMMLRVQLLETPIPAKPVACRIVTESTLQGALVSLRHGEVVASVGGFEDAGYDRAQKAQRQFGSAWKPLLFALALERGWHHNDSLENLFNVFRYGGQYYLPRPDHRDRGGRVSIVWAAALSENIASIWLLAHLHDHLDRDSLMAVARSLRMWPVAGEDTASFRIRMRDSLGLIYDDSARIETAFAESRDALAAQLASEGRQEAAWDLHMMPYGRGARDEAQKRERKQDREFLPNLRHCFLNYQEFSRKAAEFRSPDSLVLYGDLRLSDFRRLEGMMLAKPAADNALENWLDWPEFRTALALRDYVAFAHKAGIRAKLQPVLSMPLGSNDVSLVELVTAYQTILSGKVHKCLDGDWGEPCLVREIRTPQGRILFRNRVDSMRVLSPATVSQMAVLLRAVVESGTGRRADRELLLSSPDGRVTLRYPSLGKTGTTNDNRNVAFLGALPGWSDDLGGFVLDSADFVGAYVGYDDNRPLKAGVVSIAGASGGLPIWVDYARNTLSVRKYASRVDFLDLDLQMQGVAPLRVPGFPGFRPVSAKTGLPAGNDSAGTAWILAPAPLQAPPDTGVAP